MEFPVPNLWGWVVVVLLVILMIVLFFSGYLVGKLT